MSTVLVAVSPLSICMKLMLVVLSCTTGPAIQRRVPVSEQLYLYTSNRSSAWVRHRDVCLCQAQPGSGTETCACVKHSLGQAQRHVPVSSTAWVRHRDVCLCQAQPGSDTETCACVRLIIPLYLQPQHSLGQAQRRVPVSD